MSEREFYAEVQKHEGGGWGWRIARSDDGATVNDTGCKALDWYEGLRGQTMTRRGARAEARRALKNLRRYVTREEPEVITDA